MPVLLQSYQLLQAGQALFRTRPPFMGLAAPCTTKVNLDAGTAVLRGTVATDHDRDLAGRVVLLEPTVNDVVNLLAVASAGRMKRP